MKNRVTFEDVPLEDRKYRITKMDPRSACWLFSILGDKAVEGKLLSSLGKCSKEEFAEVQTLALKQISRLDENNGEVFPIPVIDHHGNWTDKDLKEDPGEVYKLTVASIMFSLSPFLNGSESTDQPLESSGLEGWEPTEYIEVSELLMAPVSAGVWKLHETFDGTYTIDDLFDILEMLDYKAENSARAEAYRKRS